MGKFQRFKYLFGLLVLVIFASSWVACNAPSVPNNGSANIDTAITAEEVQIAKDLVEGAFDDLWGAADSTKILNYHTEDFVILENGHLWDNDRIKQYMRKELKEENRPVRVTKMDYISIDKYGPSIQIAYWNAADFVRNDSIVGQANWLESALAVPTDDGWRLKMMHSTYFRK